MLPAGMTPPETAIPPTRIPPDPTDFVPAVPQPSTLSVSTGEQPVTEMPDAANVTYQNPIMQRRLPSAVLLKNYSPDSVQRLPVIEESSDETAEDEMSAPIPDSVSTSRQNSPQPITAAQPGAGQSLYNDPAPISVSAAQSRSLPVPYSPSYSGNTSSASRAATTIEQVGYRRSSATDNFSATTTSQNKSVAINNAQTR